MNYLRLLSSQPCFFVSLVFLIFPWGYMPYLLTSCAWIKFHQLLMVCGCFTIRGFSKLVLSKNIKVSQHVYLEVLCDHLPKSFEPTKVAVFQQDGVPAHTAISVTQWLQAWCPLQRIGQAIAQIGIPLKTCGISSRKIYMARMWARYPAWGSMCKLSTFFHLKSSVYTQTCRVVKQGLHTFDKYYICTV